MELNLEITACRGERPDPPVQLRVNGGCCTLGRTPDNDLVLADAERMVSGRHARIDVSGSEVRLTDLSTNGTYVNDAMERLPRNQSTRLADGDRLLIGPYEIAVSILQAEPEDDDIFGFHQPASWRPSASASPPGASEGPFSELMPGMQKHGPTADILDLLGDSGAAPSSPGVLDAAEQPFADARGLDELLSGPADAHSAPESAEPRATPVDQVFFNPPEMVAIPDGYDLLRDAEPPSSPLADPRASRDSSLFLEPFSESATEPLSDPVSEPFSDPGSEPAPPLRPSPGRPSSLTSGESSAFDLFSSSPDLPDFEPVGDVHSGANPRADGDDHRETAAPRQPTSSLTGRSRATANNVNAPIAAPPPAPPAQATSAQPRDRDALSAFLTGLGTGDSAQIADQEQFLRSAGALLRVLVGGLSATLMTRAQFKSELRLGVTTIRAAENNPFKFSVSPEDALDRLLFRPNPGFLPALEAAEQGFDDIQAHEMAMIAGLRSALRALLARFDPATLEARLADSGLDKVLPMVRKSRCWDEFTETYTQASADATEDFTELFGEAFTRAYDDQIMRLARVRRGSP